MTSTLDSGFFKQIDRCAMRGPLSVSDVSDIYMIKMEEDVTYKIEILSTFCRWYIREEKSKLFYEINTFHKNIKLIIEINPSKFLNTRIGIKEDGHYNAEVYQKETKASMIGHQKYLIDRNVTR